jgi:thiosulfate/3-mercaptopyruvate sulfurtransferase
MDFKPLITPDVLAARMELGERLVIVDTRSPEQYAAGHIPGSVNVNQIFTYLAMSTAEGLAALRDEFASYFAAAGVCGDERVVIYEDAMDNGYGQSCRGWFLLRYLGHPRVQILDGGLQSWKDSHLPLSTEVPAVARGVFTPRLDDSLMITWQQMRDALNDPNIVKLDTRARDEWEGESSSPYSRDFAPRKGRIPGAVWIDWVHMMERKAGIPRFRSRDEILDICRRVGIGPESRVYLYCFKGARASNTLVALQEAGIRDVRLYFGSWNEWARDPALPIEEGPPAKRQIAPIDGAGLAALAEKGKANPGAVRTLKCRTVLEKRFRHLNYIRSLPEHVIDEPPQLLGDDTAPNPTEALLAALGSCISVGIHANAVARGIELYKVELELEGDINITSVWGVGDLGRDKVLGLTDVRVHVHLDGNVSREELAELVAHANDWSPVANTVRNPVSLRVALADQRTPENP